MTHNDLEQALTPVAALKATRVGFLLEPHRVQTVAVLAPPAEGDHSAVMALLADGEAWSSSALALVLGVSPRSVQRALETLAEADKVAFVGRGRARRWVAPRTRPVAEAMILEPDNADDHRP